MFESKEKNTTLQASQCISWILVNNEIYINFLKYLVYNARQRIIYLEMQLFKKKFFKLLFFFTEFTYVLIMMFLYSLVNKQVDQTQLGSSLTTHIKSSTLSNVTTSIAFTISSSRFKISIYTSSSFFTGLVLSEVYINSNLHDSLITIKHNTPSPLHTLTQQQHQ